MAHEPTPNAAPSRSTATVDADVRREYLIATLADAESTVTVDDLVDDVCERVRADDGTLDDGDEVAYRVGLYHNDLPKLAAEGLVDFDPERSEVTLGTDGDGLERLH